jgi:hypothetical protein
VSGLLAGIAARALHRERQDAERAQGTPMRLTLEHLARSPQWWVSMLWQAMAKTGKGYRRPTLQRRPPEGASRWRGERRPDKVRAGTPVFTGKLNYRRSERPA